MAAAASLVAAGAPDSSIPPNDRLLFRVMRKGSDIGTHELAFSRLPNGLDITIAVNIAVTLGPLTLFRYRLHGVEQWRNGQVVKLVAQTDNDGTRESMQAVRDQRGLWVSGTKAKRYLAPASAVPATHWNPTELHAPWINPQNGRLLHPTVTPTGTTPVQLASGRDIDAQHYAVSGDANLQLWYTAARVWTGLLFTAHDGSLVRYELA